MTSCSDFMERLASVEYCDGTFHKMPNPIVLAKARGEWAWDSDGKRYLDLCAGFGVLAIGHNPPAFRKLIGAFLLQDPPPITHGMGDVYPSEAKIELLEFLKDLLPPRFKLGALAMSGSQSIEIAIKTAILARKKTGFICFQNSYHGLDLGILPLTSRSDFREPFILSGSCISVVRLPYGLADEKGFKKAIEILESEGVGFAGVVVEPVQGRGGMVEPPRGWLAEIADWAHRAGGVVIFDEVLCGLGRSGRMTHADEVSADLVCFGKALGGGFPLSACFGTEELMGAWPVSKGEAVHTGTFFGHPFSCLAGLSALSEIVDQGLVSRSAELGLKVKSYLQDRFIGNLSVKKITGAGMMVAIHFQQDGFGGIMMERARSKGILALASGERGECLAMTPPLNIDHDALFQGLDDIVSII